MFGRGRKNASEKSESKAEPDDVRYRQLQTYHRQQQAERARNSSTNGAGPSPSPSRKSKSSARASNGSESDSEYNIFNQHPSLHSDDLREHLRDQHGIARPSVAEVGIAALTSHERPQNMSKEQVADFVRQIGRMESGDYASTRSPAAERHRSQQFEKYAANFYRSDVDGRKLMSLSKEEMRQELGVQSPEHQEKIVGWLKQLSSSVGPRDAAVRDAPNEFAKQPDEARSSIARTLQQQEDDDFESRIAWRDAALLAKDAALAMLSARVDALLRRDDEWKHAARVYRSGGKPQFPPEDITSSSQYSSGSTPMRTRDPGSHHLLEPTSPTRPVSSGRPAKPGSRAEKLNAVSGALSSLREDLAHLRTETRRRVTAVGSDMMDVAQAMNEALRRWAQEFEIQSRLRDENRRLHNEVVDLRGNIRVFLRVRPPTAGEIGCGPLAVSCPSNTSAMGTGDLVAIRLEPTSSVMEPTPEEERGRRRTFAGAATAVMGAVGLMGAGSFSSSRRESARENVRYFEFDNVFSPAASQQRVFTEVEMLIRSVYEGFNVCIFAYGQTGSGKTHTVIGPEGGVVTAKESAGVCYRALSSLFAMRDEAKGAVEISVSVEMREIYNEQIFDLLSRSDEAQLPTWSGGGASSLSGGDRNRSAAAENRRVKLQTSLNNDQATRIEVNTPQDVLDVMSEGSKARVTHETKKNERSSRSHMILTVYCDITPVANAKSSSRRMSEGSQWNPFGSRGASSAQSVGVETARHSMLHLIDLAGSERVKVSGATDQRLKEAQHINKSLSALGDVISALAKRTAHVPFRNSKLTQLLASSLGGQSKVMMFAHVSPGADSMGESLSTLQFASRARAVELGRANANVGMQQAEIEETKRSLQTMAAEVVNTQKETVAENFKLKNQILKLMTEKSDLKTEAERLRLDIKALRTERRASLSSSMPRASPSASSTYGTPSSRMTSPPAQSPQRFRATPPSGMSSAHHSRIEPLATVRERPRSATREHMTHGHATDRYSVGRQGRMSHDRLYTTRTTSSSVDPAPRSQSVPRRELSEGRFDASSSRSKRLGGGGGVTSPTARPQSATPQRPKGVRRWV